ncbi:MAG: hypothetical protein ACREEM_43245, partial [Blastocatellia bacterium]
LMAVSGLTKVASSVAASYLDKLHDALTAKEPGWKITKKESSGNRTTYRWEMAEVGKAEIHIFTTGSPEEAAVLLQKRMGMVQVGPTAKLKNLGDEAYIWKGPNRDTGIIRFRKGNFVIDIGASKSAIAEKFSTYAAEAVPEK